MGRVNNEIDIIGTRMKLGGRGSSKHAQGAATNSKETTHTHSLFHKNIVYLNIAIQVQWYRSLTPALHEAKGISDRRACATH